MCKTIPRFVAIILAAFLLVLTTKSFVLDLALVEGPSMYPTLRPGSVVVVLRCAYGLRFPGGNYLLRWSVPRTGEVVAALNPRSGRAVVKRVVAALPGLSSTEPSLFLMGDNPDESLDSREYGLLPVESVLGRVIILKTRVNR